MQQRHNNEAIQIQAYIHIFKTRQTITHKQTRALNYPTNTTHIPQRYKQSTKRVPKVQTHANNQQTLFPKDADIFKKR